MTARPTEPSWSSSLITMGLSERCRRNRPWTLIIAAGRVGSATSLYWGGGSASRSQVTNYLRLTFGLPTWLTPGERSWLRLAPSAMSPRAIAAAP